MNRTQRRIKKNKREKGPAILSGKGDSYSEVAKETEQNCAYWLIASGITEQQLIEKVDGNDFHLTFWADANEAIAVLHHSTGEIARPLLWRKESGIDFNGYKVDLALLLLYISGKCTNAESKQKIRTFLKEDLKMK